MPAGAASRKPPAIVRRCPAGVRRASRSPTNPPADDAEESAGRRQDAEPEAGLGHGELLDPVEIEREPVVEGADREGHEHADRADHDERRRAEEPDDALEEPVRGPAARVGGQVVLRAARRVAEAPGQDREGDARQADQEERGPPSVTGPDETARHHADRAAEGDGGVEERVDEPPPLAREEVRDHRARGGTVGGLADAHEGAGGEQLPVGAGESREEGRRPPHADADGDEAIAGHPVAQHARAESSRSDRGS